MFDKYEYSELWEIMTGLSVVIAKHPLHTYLPSFLS